MNSETIATLVVISYIVITVTIGVNFGFLSAIMFFISGLLSLFLIAKALGL